MVNVGTKPAEEDEGEDMIAAEGGRACDRGARARARGLNYLAMRMRMMN